MLTRNFMVYSQSTEAGHRGVLFLSLHKFTGYPRIQRITSTQSSVRKYSTIF